MPPYFQHYLESNAVCVVIFGIMLAHNLLRQDRQEKLIKFDRTLLAFMGYFVSDTIWAGILSGVIPANDALVCAVNFLDYLFMAAITFFWLRYAMTVEQVPNRDETKTVLALL